MKEQRSQERRASVAAERREKDQRQHERRMVDSWGDMAGGADRRAVPGRREIDRRGNSRRDHERREDGSQPGSGGPPLIASGTMLREIIDHKGSDFLFVPTGATLLQVVDFLAANRVGIAPVCNAAGELLGVFSERDVVRELSLQGADALLASVDDVMTTDLITCSSSDLVRAVAQLMIKRNLRHLPVVDDGTLVGLVSSRDILGFFAAGG